MEKYTTSPSVRWAFGMYAPMAWKLDTRYHAFGTFDSMRKVPLSRIRHGRHLNQGFHTLHFTDGTTDLGSEIWNHEFILPIRHFKMLKLFSKDERERMSAQVAEATSSQYHARTTENIRRIFGTEPKTQIERLMALPLRPYEDRLLKTIRPETFLAT